MFLTSIVTTNVHYDVIDITTTSGPSYSPYIADMAFLNYGTNSLSYWAIKDNPNGSSQAVYENLYIANHGNGIENHGGTDHTNHVSMHQMATGAIGWQHDGAGEEHTLLDLYMENAGPSGSTYYDMAACIKINGGFAFQIISPQLQKCGHPIWVTSGGSIQVIGGYLDTSHYGTLLDGTGAGIEKFSLEGTWVGSTASGSGIIATGSVAETMLSDIQCYYNNGACFDATGATDIRGTSLRNIAAGGNGQNGSSYAIEIGAGLTNFDISGVVSAPSDLQQSQNYGGIRVAAGSSDYYSITNNRLQVGSNDLTDGGTGTHKLVAYNLLATGPQALPSSIQFTAPDRTVTANTSMVSGDNGGQINTNSASAITLSITSSIFPAGQTVAVANQNTGITTIGGVTLNGSVGNTLGKGGFVSCISNGSTGDCVGFPGYGTITSNSLMRFSSAVAGAPTASAISDNGTTVTISEPVTFSGLSSGTCANGLALATGGGLVTTACASGGSITVDGTAGITTINSGTNITSSISGSTATLNASGGGTSAPPAPQGRLTCQSGLPLPNADVATCTTIYYDAYVGNQVPYWNGAATAGATITGGELSDVMVSSGTGAIGNNDVFDVYFIVASSTPHICVATNNSGGGWTADGGSLTARGTAYSVAPHLTKGYYTNVNAISYCYNGSTNYAISADQGTYLGSLYTTSAGTTQMVFHPANTTNGSNNFVGLFNAYNRAYMLSVEQDQATSYNITSSGSGTWGPVHGSTANRVSFVDGLGVLNTNATVQEYMSPTGAGNFAAVGIGCQNITTSSANATPVSLNSGMSYNVSWGCPLGSGLRYIQALEARYTSSTTTVFFNGLSVQGMF
jgi:hypothetical protein